MREDFYAVLGVPRHATELQVRQRFLELARSRHPDRFQGAEKVRAEGEFQKITEAANVLGDPERRRRHDAELAQAQAPSATAAGGGNADLVRVYMQRGVKAYKEDNFRDAADNFDRATKADPRNSKAWHSLALACSRDPKWRTQAMAAIAKACELEPMKASYAKLAGRLHAASGIADKAEQYYRQALQWGGEDPEIDAALAELQGKGRSRLSSLFGR